MSPCCPSAEMELSVLAVENILRYSFRNKKLLEEALTHPSFPNAISYQRLELLGDAVLGLTIINHLFLVYPTLEHGQLSLLRAANVSTEKLARITIRHGFHRYIRHNAPALVHKVREFVEAVSEEDDPVAHGGSVKAPKVLADIVESVAASVYVDVDFDLQKTWVIIRGLWEPFVTPDDLEQQPQPVTMLFEICQKNGKQVDIKHWRKGAKSIASVFVDGRFVASASSDQKDIARLDAAKVALDKLAHLVPVSTMMLDYCAGIDGTFEIEAAKHKLHELCGMKKWPKPVYSIEKDAGPPHEKKFVCSVQIATVDGILQMSGDEKSRVKDAENSAASFMIWALQERVKNNSKSVRTTSSCPSAEMEVSVLAVENIIRYSFRNKKLLEEALTHSSFPDAVSYERLELLGDAVLGLAIISHLFLAYPTLDPGQLSLLRSANVSTEKLARVAIRHGFHRFVRHNAPALVHKVKEFVEVVAQEDDLVTYGGLVKAPKVLADVVESVAAAAVYVDFDFDLQKTWAIIRGLLEPFVTPDDLEQQPQPVTMLFEICQKNGKQVDIKHWRNGDKSIASVYVDGQFVASASSDQKDIARLDAAKVALDKLANLVPVSTMTLNYCAGIDGTFEIEAAKHKLHELCGMKKWPKPVYSIEKDAGPPHEKKFVCSVQIATINGALQMSGDEKSRVKDAENSAASLMIRALQECNYCL
ncbi:ribonuclease 3-like protein 3 isoform X2 [Gastrolobium bilobum]|uniref:ribonuclease 3-like protein 3 isoform X2 n=1 Tax=Gastrolobium bilobum TaxID=150636 RepID=UPI002AB0761C|nr:ribonuclease 3-like protein 3 isoform X2 [Gastrolobium bilobum]